jgi:ornithine carbamoyltransferase
VARVFGQQTLEQMASRSRVPVINALSDQRHPCQALADWMTVLEKKGRIAGVRAAFIGEGNNVAASLALLGAALGAEVCVASPAGRNLAAELLISADRLPGRIVLTESPEEAARGADVLYTDTWVSMGREADSAALRRTMAGYRIDDALVKLADPEVILMHCLPAVRGEEIDVEQMYGPRSAIWDQAENRLHAQKALLLRLLR